MSIRFLSPRLCPSLVTSCHTSLSRPPFLPQVWCSRTLYMTRLCLPLMLHYRPRSHPPSFTVPPAPWHVHACLLSALPTRTRAAGKQGLSLILCITSCYYVHACLPHRQIDPQLLDWHFFEGMKEGNRGKYWNRDKEGHVTLSVPDNTAQNWKSTSVLGSF